MKEAAPLSNELAREAAHHRALADEAIASVPPYPADRFAGRGVVICASGLRYFVCAWICVRMLQRLGCALPIEFWALGADDWTPEMERLTREELGVSDCRLPRVEDRARFTDMWAERAGKAGWELKPYSIIESRFREVLLLDADIVPVADPTFLFDSPQLAEHGAIFWPDPTPIGPERAAWEIMGVPYRGDVTMNSGRSGRAASRGRACEERQKWIGIVLYSPIVVRPNADDCPRQSPCAEVPLCAPPI